MAARFERERGCPRLPVGGGTNQSLCFVKDEHGLGIATPCHTSLSIDVMFGVVEVLRLLAPTQARILETAQTVSAR